MASNGVASKLDHYATCTGSESNYRRSLSVETLPQLAAMPSETPFEIKLPPETWDHVLDHLWNDHPALAACSLTCRAWLPTTRLHLFYTIRLLDVTTYTRFQRLLQRSPHIAFHVRNLSLKRSSLLLESDSDLSQVLLSLTRVENLSVRFTINHYISHSIFPLSGRLRQNLSTAFTMVTTLRFTQMAFEGRDLPLLLCSCPRLSSVHLRNVRWYYELDENRPLPPDLIAITPDHEIRIDDLVLANATSNIARWLLDGPLQLRLRKLELQSHDLGCSPYLLKILEETEASLEHLVLSADKISPRPTDYGPIFGRAKMASLRSVRLQNVQSPSTVFGDLLWIPIVLAEIQSDSLRKVHIDFSARSMSKSRATDWDQIDANLARMARNEPQIVLSVDTPLSMDAARALIAGLVADYLPRLKAGNIRFSVVCKHPEGRVPKRVFWFP